MALQGGEREIYQNRGVGRGGALLYRQHPGLVLQQDEDFFLLAGGGVQIDEIVPVVLHRALQLAAERFVLAVRGHECELLS